MLKGYVHIVESPSATDLLDGRTEGRMLSETLQLAGIPFQYNLAATAEALEQCFRERLVDGIRKNQSHPMFHMSMHGNQDGIQLTNGTFVDWASLRRLIAPVSNLATNGMLLCMSTCHGGAARRIAIETMDEVKLWALVGPNAAASWADSAIAYAAFYHRLFKGDPVDDAVAAMRVAAGNDTFEIMHGVHLHAGWQSYRRQVELEFVEMLQRTGAWKPGGGSAA